MPQDFPKTIGELREWYQAHGLPPEEVTRFFIGKNIQEPRAFGIYEENGRFIVYKNKDDGKRSIRYEGIDEAYAVRELTLRLQKEIGFQKQLNAEERAAQKAKNDKTLRKCVIAFFATILVVCGVTAGLHFLIPSEGYYSRGSSWYVYYDGGWYGCQDGAWAPVTPEPELKSHFRDFFAGETCPSGVPNFASSSYWHPENGYYHCNNRYYYYQNTLWYLAMDDGWEETEYPPEVFSDRPGEYYLGEKYDGNYGVSDFSKSEYAQDSDSWSSGDSWDSGSTDFSSDW